MLAKGTQGRQDALCRRRDVKLGFFHVHSKSKMTLTLKWGYFKHAHSYPSLRSFDQKLVDRNHPLIQAGVRAKGEGYEPGTAE
jgi:hypothetical protein